jgi:CBS domain-containing protein
MSARAAWRLESLGFTKVHCYRAGKLDWLGSGLPREGRMTGFPTAGDALRADVPTCRPDERVGDAAERARAAGWDMCVVVNDRRVVLGVLRKKALAGDPSRAAEAAMELGPTTFRPNELLAGVAFRLTQAGVQRVLITTGDGELLGVLDRAEAARRTGAAPPPARRRRSAGPVSPSGPG